MLIMDEKAILTKMKVLVNSVNCKDLKKKETLPQIRPK